MQFTVLIPTRDRLPALQSALAALSAQTLPGGAFEVVVVDDGSRDGTAAFLAGAAGRGELRTVRLEGRGPAAARNAGAREARGRLLAFTDDDCRVPADWLARIAGHLEPSPGEPPADAVGGPADNVLESVIADTYQRMCDHFYVTHNREPGRARFLTTNNFACRRDDFLEAGGFDERFRLGGSDREFAVRLGEAGKRVAYDPSLRVQHAHAFSLATYLRHLHRQGRGSHLMHARLRAERGYAPPRTGLADLPALLGRAARGVGPWGAAQRVALVLAGQAAAATGFIRAAAARES